MPTRRSPEVQGPQGHADTQSHLTPGEYPTASDPTWYLDARPLNTCCDHDEYAIDCPEGDHEAIAWRSRPGYAGGGWACPLGHRGALWQLLPGVTS